MRISLPLVSLRPVDSTTPNRARAAAMISASLTPAGTRTAVQVGEAMLSVLAHNSSPIALMPARQARAVRAWRRHTFSGPSSRYWSSAPSRPLISATEGVKGNGCSLLQAFFQSLRLRTEANGAFGIGLDMLPGALADGHQGQARRAAQALAGAGDEDVGEAIVGMDVHAAEGGDGIDDQQAVMLAHDLADLARRIDGAGRRVVMDQRDDLDVRALAERLRHLGGIDRLVVRDLDLHHLLVIARRPVAEALAVDAGRKVQHHVIGA